MAKMINERLVLNNEESERFVRNLLHPNKEMLARRDAFIKDVKIAYKPDGQGFTVEVPELD